MNEWHKDGIQNCCFLYHGKLGNNVLEVCLLSMFPCSSTSGNIVPIAKFTDQSNFLHQSILPPLSSAVSGLITATVVSTGNIFSISLRAAECDFEPCRGLNSLSST